MKRKHIFILIATAFISFNSINAQTKPTPNETINNLIEKKRAYNKTVGTGFLIQLYNGSESRARTIMGNFKAKYNWVKTKLVYDTPDWKVQVGNYRTRLDADKALNKFKEEFSGGIIIKK